MSRISDEVLLTSLEVALAVAPESTLLGLNAGDARQQRRARLDLAQHLVERMGGFEIHLEDAFNENCQPSLFGEMRAPG